MHSQIFVLIYSLFLPIPYCFATDMPQALQAPFENSPFLLSLRQIDFFYTSLNLPNIAFVILGGMLIDKLGTTKSFFFFALNQIIGGIWCFCAIRMVFNQMDKYWYALYCLARAWLGTFGQNLFSLQGVFLSKYINSKKVGSFLGIGICVPWMMSSVNSLLTPVLQVYFGNPSVAHLLVIVLGIITMIAGLLLIRLTKNLKVVQQSSEEFSLADVGRLGQPFWLIVLIALLGEFTFQPTMQNLNDSLGERYGFDYQTSGLLASLVLFQTGVFSLFLWKNIYHKIKKTTMLFLSQILLAVAYLIFYLLPLGYSAATTVLVVAAVTMIALGFSAWSTVVFGSIPTLVDCKSLGTGFGIVGSAVATAMSVSPMIMASIIEGKQRIAGYQDCQLFKIGMAAGTFAATLILKSKHGDILQAQNEY